MLSGVTVSIPIPLPQVEDDTQGFGRQISMSLSHRNDLVTRDTPRTLQDLWALTPPHVACGSDHEHGMGTPTYVPSSRVVPDRPFGPPTQSPSPLPPGDGGVQGSSNTEVVTDTSTGVWGPHTKQVGHPTDVEVPLASSVQGSDRDGDNSVCVSRVPVRPSYGYRRQGFSGRDRSRTDTPSGGLWVSSTDLGWGYTRPL